MQEVKIISVTDSERTAIDNNESDQEIENRVSTVVNIGNIVQNEIILDVDASVEPVNLDEHSKECTDPFVDILAPDNINCILDNGSSPKDDTGSEDEYVYMSDNYNDQDYNVPHENNDRIDQLRCRPGPKSKTRNIQTVQEPPKEDIEHVTSIADETVKMDLDGNSRMVVKNKGIKRRSSRNATKLKTYEIDSLFAAQIEQSQYFRSKKSQRNNVVQFGKDAIQEESKKEEKDLFETPLNAPFIDTSSDEDYFKPLNPEPRRAQRREPNTWIRNWNRMSSDRKFRKKRNQIPDDVYFNPKTPLHVLYSYEGSSSEDEVEPTATQPVLDHNVPAPIIPSRIVKHQLKKMPPVHKIEAKKKKQKNSEIKSSVVQKSTVFQQLNDLKRMFKASGIKININELIKGSKTFQERCDRIRNCLQENGVRGRPTLAKCKQLKKQLKTQKKKPDNNNQLGGNATNETKQIESVNESNDNNLIKSHLDKQINAMRTEFNEHSDSISIEGELKSEENVEPTNLVEILLDTNESSNIDTINQILNSELSNLPNLSNDLIECAVESVDYFEQVRNI